MTLKASMGRPIDPEGETGMTFREAEKEEAAAYTSLAGRLWPDAGADELESEFAELADDADSAVFLALDGQAPVGFAHCQVRSDYVEGAGSSPVGYIEGLYVLEGYRNKGIARELLNKCEDWARSKGLDEMASDCEINNQKSIGFHIKAGFREANRVVCFIKSIEKPTGAEKGEKGPDSAQIGT